MQTTKIYSVSEITRQVKSLIQQFEGIWIEGEISNFVPHSSGHMYFSLKDEKSVIRGAFFKNANQHLKFKPGDGMMVVVHGSLDLYEKSGQYQIIVDNMEPKGVGALQLRFEQLKAELSKEGLFDAARKRKLPLLPRKIGIVTSPTGAAIRDMINVLERRFPNVHVVLNPVRVQGDGAAEEVAAAIKEMNEDGSFEVLIIGRGGGSLEDLWAFNEEVVARAVFASKIPVVSAVGHEIDFTISDFVADLRAPTPSAAAELVIANKTDLVQKLGAYEMRLTQDLKKKYLAFKEKLEWIKKSGLAMGLKRTLDIFKERVANAAKSPAFTRPKERVTQLKQEVDEFEAQLAKSIKHFLENRRNEVKIISGKVESLNPLNILERGYSVTTKNGKIIKDSDELKIGDEIGVRLHKGKVIGKVIKENE
ncbi:MAG: exodeoxyribonuclease VII large subunit [Candidatus Firestonebacteria bacterium]